MEENEEKKREKYNPDDVFNKKSENIVKNLKEEIKVIEYKKESFLQKVVIKIKRLFGK